MFKKVFRTKTQSIMKGSDRKKLRAEILKSFDGLTTESVTELIPNKEEVTIVKIQTFIGDNAFIYCVNKIPLMFEIDKVLYPSVYLLWKFPDLVPRFTTWPPVFKKMTEGADLMLPGIVLKEELTPRTFKHIQKGQLCSVNLDGNKSPVAVGYTLIGGSDFFDSGMRGKGVHPLHYVGDELWSFGDKSMPPQIDEDTADQSDNQEGNVEENGSEMIAAVSETSGDNSCRNENDIGVNEEIENVEESTGAHGGDVLDMDQLDLNDFKNNKESSNEENIPDDVEVETAITPEEMDEMFEFCFLCALKNSLKKSDLPVPSGTFFKAHMTRFCQSGRPLDIKKSSYKKLSKFLQKQEKTGIIKLSQISKGVDGIKEMDRSHEMLRGFEAPEPNIRETPSAPGQYTPPQITEMFAVTAEVLPLCKDFGLSKKMVITAQELRQIMTEYIRCNNLQDQTNKSEVVLDPILAGIALKMEEGDRSTLKWDELFSRLLKKMSHVFEIKVQGQPAVIQKGTLEPIKIDVLQRASNKKVTVIENLDIFGIDPKDFGHTIQVKVACSASVCPSAQKNKGPQVVVQGNQVGFVADLLLEKYKIPRRFLKGLDKAPKSKKK